MAHTEIAHEALALPRALGRASDPQPPAAEASSPWPIFRSHARSIVPGVVTCLVILITIELAVFRSGFFISELQVSSPDFPAAKLALAQRSADARVLYVGDSTILTGVAPAEVSARCACGPGFNGGFAAATPWLTSAMTKRLLEHEHPALVVIGLAPWDVASGNTFNDSELAHEILTPSELGALDVHVDIGASIDEAFASIVSAYGERLLIKEWIASLMPQQRYDEGQRGYYAVPGSATTANQLAAEVARMKVVHPGVPSIDSPGVLVTRSLIANLRARGIVVAVLVPPLHPAAYVQNGAYLEGAEVVIRDLAREQGAPLIDCRSATSVDDFRDLLHLRESGALKLSTCVGEQIRALIGG